MSWKFLTTFDLPQVWTPLDTKVTVATRSSRLRQSLAMAPQPSGYKPCSFCPSRTGEGHGLGWPCCFCTPSVFLALLGVKERELLLALCPMGFSLSPSQKRSGVRNRQSQFSTCSHLGCSLLEGMHSHSFPSPPSDPCLLACEAPAHPAQVPVYIRSQCAERHKDRSTASGTTWASKLILSPLREHG